MPCHVKRDLPATTCQHTLKLDFSIEEHVCIYKIYSNLRLYSVNLIQQLIQSSFDVCFPAASLNSLADWRSLVRPALSVSPSDSSSSR